MRQHAVMTMSTSSTSSAGPGATGRLRSIACRVVLLLVVAGVHADDANSTEPPTMTTTSMSMSSSASMPTASTTSAIVNSTERILPSDNSNGSVLNSSAVNLSARGLSKLAQFSVVGDVVSLNLSRNQLSSLADISTFGFSLKCLDLSFNQVQNLFENALANFTYLQQLNLSHNALKTLEDGVFKGLVALQHLDLSFNHLETIAPGALELPSLMRLIITSNPALTEDAALFLATGTRLQTMEASSIAVRTVPSSLTHSLRSLHLVGNMIASVRCGDMDSYPLLQLLDLSSNGLGEIEEDALGRLEMLTILYLTNNSLQSIPHSLPERLKLLHLERNRIESLRPADLELPHLEVLLLRGNRIKVIADGAFTSLTSLVTLDLSANSLLELPAGVFGGPLALRVLRLQGLRTAFSLKETAFPLPATEHLIVLDVKSSPGVARQWFADTAAMAAARELQELDVGDCGLEQLPRDLLHYMPQLRALHLHGNRLNCTGLEWLADWLRLSEVAAEEDVVCNSPNELWGVQLVDLQPLQTPSQPSASRKHKNKNKKKKVNLDEFASPDVNSLEMITPTSLPTAMPMQPKSEASTLATDDKQRHAAHPGMYLLIVGIMCGTLVLITLTSRWSRRPPRDDLLHQQLRHYDRRHQQQHDAAAVDLIEVSALPSVAELW